MSQLCKRVSRKAQAGLSQAFQKWASVVARCNIPMFVVFLILMIYLGQGKRHEHKFSSTDFEFAPEGNQSVQDFDRAVKFFINSLATLQLRFTIEAKNRDRFPNASILSLDAFREMVEFDRAVRNITVDGDKRFADICETFKPESEESMDPISFPEQPEAGQTEKRLCKMSPKPIDFVYDEQINDYNLSGFHSDVDLISHLQNGLTESTLYRSTSQVLPMDDMFAKVSPSSFYQNPVTGENNIEAAQAAKYTLYLSVVTQSPSRQLMAAATAFVQSFNEDSQYISIGVSYDGLWYRDFMAAMDGIMDIIIYAGVAMLTYCLLMIGSCSPIHLRIIVPLAGISCVYIAVEAGYGFGYLLNLQTQQVHDIIPFIVLGIGVDDMFVIVNALDQTPLTMTPAERLKAGMKHAGPSITITSLTNAMAFLAGSATSIRAVHSFCLFCSLSVSLLYLSMMTIFLPVLYWDCIRVSKRKGEFCGLYFCKEDSALFCRGKFLSEPQKQYSKIPAVGEQRDQSLANSVHNTTERAAESRDLSQPSRRANLAVTEEIGQGQARPNNRDANHKSVVASRTEKFLATKMAPQMISLQGQVSILFIYLILTIIAIYGCLQVEVYWNFYDSMTMPSYTEHQYRQALKLFDIDYSPQIYVKLDDTDFFDPETQLKYLQYEDVVQRCQHCSQKWYKPNSLDSWFSAFRRWVDTGACEFAREGIDPFAKTLEPQVFNDCFYEWRVNDAVGKTYAETVKVQRTDGSVRGFFLHINTIRIENPGVNAVKYLNDVRRIDREYGLQETFTFSQAFLDLEIYRVIVEETFVSFSLAFATVLLVVLFITFDVTVTLMVLLCVLLVCLYLLAIVHFWGLTFNNMVAINLSFALGISLDYSTHIANMYLFVEAPSHLATKKEKRQYKARKAISMMGSSVFHGAFSTLLAVSFVSFAQVYTFMVFFKTWVCIIVFGLLNGTILLPILLSIMGPVNNERSPSEEGNLQLSDQTQQSLPTVLEKRHVSETQV